jgi:hypothetical protein
VLFRQPPRLALEVADRRYPGFPDSCFWVELACGEDVAEVLAEAPDGREVLRSEVG